jgi:Ca2+-binding EF-hand superfamily protein
VTRTTLLGSATLVLLGGTVLAAPPVPSATGLRGANYSAAPDKLVERGIAFARPRAGAFITSLEPDSRAAIVLGSTKPAHLRFSDTQEVVVFSPHRPIRIHLSIQYEGKSIAEMWRERLKKAFDYFDRDKDGYLNGFEVQNIFSDTGLTQMLQNGFYQPTPQDRPTLEKLDTDGDRKVSFEEFVTYYKMTTNQILRPQAPIAENPYNAAATEALFKLLDANGDGKLTKDEVKNIEKLLASHDADEDECLSLAELLPNFNDPRGRRGEFEIQLDGGMRRVPPSTANQSVLTFEAGRIPGTLTQQLIKKYDKDGDFELTREESGFDEATFARLDKDGNGRLDGEELDEWRTGPADLDVVMSLAPKAADCVAKITTSAKELAARGFTFKQVEAGRVIIRTGRQPIEFWAYGTVMNGYQQPSLKLQYQYLFQQAAGGKEYILEKDLTGPNAVQFQFIRTIFDAADRDGDGKMTKAEFDDFFDLQDSFRNVALAVTPTVQTPTLFQLLDENRDGRLSVRELRTAWDRLIALEPSGGDVITRAAIQPSVSLRLTRGIDRAYINQLAVVDVRYQNPNQVVQPPQKGPMWFRKMDRNGDGDVSRSEFLGTKAEFDEIDTDHDGLISLEEAEAWDKKMREKDKDAKKEDVKDPPKPDKE